MRVALMWPAVRMNGWNSNQDGRSCEETFQNHGLACISANLKKHGHDAFLYDLRAMKNWDEFRTRVSSDQFDVFAFGSYSVDSQIAEEATQIVRNLKPNVPIIGGGVHISQARVMEFGAADCVVWGEGEEVMLWLLDKIAKKEPLPKIVEVGKVITRKKLNAMPFSDRTLFNTKVEMNSPFLPLLPKPFYTTNIGRGCYYSKCLSSDTIINGHRLSEIKSGMTIRGFDERASFATDTTVVRVEESNNDTQQFEIELLDGKKLKGTGDHKLYTKRGWVEIQNLEENDEVMVE